MNAMTPETWIPAGDLTTTLSRVLSPCGPAVVIDAKDATDQHKWRDEVMFDRRLTASVRLMGLILSTHVHRGDIRGMKGWAWPSQTTLAAEAGCSVRQAQRHLDTLASYGYLASKRRGNTSTIYRLHWPKYAFDPTAKPEADTTPMSHQDPWPFRGGGR